MESQQKEIALDDLAILNDLIGGPAGVDALSISNLLLNRYGTLAGIMRASRTNELMDIAPAIIDRLRKVDSRVHALPHDEPLLGHKLSTSSAVTDFLFSQMAGLARETFRVLFLDAGNVLIEDRLMWEGTVNKVQVHKREVVRIALEHGATALILAHNHPSGQPEPSKDDIILTREIIDACSILDIVVHDHVIVARGGIFSMRASLHKLFAKQELSNVVSRGREWHD